MGGWGGGGAGVQAKTIFLNFSTDVSSHVGPFPCGPVMWAPRQLRQSCRPRHARAGTGDLTERGVYVALTSWPRRGWLTSVLSLYDN